jgi:hypothetical protein
MAAAGRYMAPALETSARQSSEVVEIRGSTGRITRAPRKYDVYSLRGGSPGAESEGPAGASKVPSTAFGMARGRVGGRGAWYVCAPDCWCVVCCEERGGGCCCCWEVYGACAGGECTPE